MTIQLAQQGFEDDSLASALFDLIPCPVWVHDAETLNLLCFNSAARKRLGLSPEDTSGSVLQLVPDWELRAPGGRGSAQTHTARLCCRDGSMVEVELSVRRMMASGRLVWLVIANDLAGASPAALAEVEARYQSIFHNAVEGMFLTTADGQYLDANPALARIYGYSSAAELIASVTDISRQLYVDPTRRDAFVRLMQACDVVEGFESQILRKDGAMVWISECVRAIRDADENLIRYEGTVIDITQRKVAEEQLKYDASHDKLTGLPNRSYFMRCTSEALLEVPRGRSCALLFIDFDRFKLINDSLGHLAGDQFLVQAGRRLVEAVRPGDTVARLGGDEFGILLPGVQNLAAATHVADRIEQVLAKPFKLSGRQLFLSASLGIALADSSYARPEDLLRDADVAMYRAKERGPACRELFDIGMRGDALRQLQLETDLRAAVEQGQFVLHYQPLVHLESGRTEALEALVRWSHPDRGTIYPAEFISVAEKTGAIREIGDWVLETACRQARDWHAQAGDSCPISINVSSQQLLQPGFVASVGQALDAAGMNGDRLKIEITETVLMENPEQISRMLASLRERGVRICLDDFGTGFSSFSYLQRFPIDELKIDRSFVARLGTGDPSRTILKAIVTLAESLGLSAVAEGVETVAQADELRALGCPYAQGYLFSPPLPAPAMGRLMSRGVQRAD